MTDSPREAPTPKRVVLVAGPVKPNDRVGHHDCLAGCGVLATLLCQVAGVKPMVVADGWPAGIDIPPAGAPADIERATLAGLVTPRRSRWAAVPRKLWRGLAGTRRW